MKPNLQHAIERVERPGGSHEGVGRKKKLICVHLFGGRFGMDRFPGQVGMVRFPSSPFFKPDFCRLRRLCSLQLVPAIPLLDAGMRIL